MRVILFGHSWLGAGALRFLRGRGIEVAALTTHADDPAERPYFPVVAAAAAAEGIPVRLAPPYRRLRCAAEVAALAPDLILSAGFRSPIAADAFAAAPLGAFNLHPSLLPRYRGRSPVNWAVLRGERETGLTLHHMIEEVDAGDIVLACRAAIGPDDTALEVICRLEGEIGGLLAQALPLIEGGRAPRRPQDPAAATAFGGRRPEDGRIDWSLPAQAIHDLVRAVTHPFPGAFTERGGRKIFIWRSRPVSGDGIPAGEGKLLPDGRFAIGAGEGMLEVLRFGLGDGLELPGEGLERLTGF
jgi:methionyl-tRNA formyltransferase